jgi:hypothetical protein
MIKLRIGFYLILVFQMYLGTMVMKISDTVDKQRSSYLEPNGISGTPPLSGRVES